MKNDNLLWGMKRIQGELLKLDISLSTKTIRKILQTFRRQGKVRSSLTWKKFPTAQIQSIYAMDFSNRRHLAGQANVCLRDHLTQDTRDRAVCPD
jgi:hypothetical protein